MFISFHKYFSTKKKKGVREKKEPKELSIFKFSDNYNGYHSTVNTILFHKDP